MLGILTLVICGLTAIPVVLIAKLLSSTAPELLFDFVEFWNRIASQLSILKIDVINELSLKADKRYDNQDTGTE